MTQPPENSPKPLDYARSPTSSRGKTALGIIVGIFGYLGLLVGTVLVGALALPTPQSKLTGRLFDVSALVVPLLLMLLTSRLAKSKPMFISTLITFGVIALSCGAYAIFTVY